jgi:hypothetical protein
MEELRMIIDYNLKIWRYMKTLFLKRIDVSLVDTTSEKSDVKKK